MPDPLLCDYTLPHYRRFHPLGFPLDVFTNSEMVLNAAQESWGRFTHTYDRQPVILRIGITEGGADQPLSPPVYRGHRNLITMILDAENFAVCDLGKGFAFAWLTSSLIRDTSYFRYFFLEACAYLLITSAYLTAVHAACVQWEGQGVLLTGESGAGKSSLAYACAKSGWTLISDDASYLVREGDLCEFTGNPYQIRLRDSASSLFPEFAGSDFTTRLDGKLTIEVPTSSLANVKISSCTKVQTAIFLKRNGTEIPELVPLPKAEAFRRWSESVCYGDDDFRAAHRQGLLKLLDVDVYELRYAEASTAVGYLEKFLSRKQ
jgi:hypothetical protein